MDIKTKIDPAEPIGDVEVEKFLLGGLIMNNNVLHDISDIVDEEQFLLPIHQKIYSSVQERRCCMVHEESCRTC